MEANRKELTKLMILFALFCGMIAAIFPVNVNADEPDPEPEPISVAATSRLDGSLAPYIELVPNSGSIALHFNGKAKSFVEGQAGYLVFTFPKEFKAVMKETNFKQVISGSYTGPGNIGAPTISYTNENTFVYSDRIIFKIPNHMMNATGKYSSDIVIDYGKLIAENPQLSIPSSILGYQFKTGFYFADGLDIVAIEPVLGKDSGSWTSKDTEAKW